MKVKVKTNRFTYGQVDYKAGEVVDVSDHEGQSYIDSNLVDEVKSKRKSKSK